MIVRVESKLVYDNLIGCIFKSDAKKIINYSTQSYASKIVRSVILPLFSIALADDGNNSVKDGGFI